MSPPGAPDRQPVTHVCTPIDVYVSERAVAPPCRPGPDTYIGMRAVGRISCFDPFEVVGFPNRGPRAPNFKAISGPPKFVFFTLKKLACVDKLIV